MVVMKGYDPAVWAVKPAGAAGRWAFVILGITPADSAAGPPFRVDSPRDPFMLKYVA
jgi:hypothetical protein